MLKKILFGILILILALVVIYALGPREQFGQLVYSPPKLSYELASIDSILQLRESQVDSLKPDNQSKIIWRDSIPIKRDFVLLYLHGFSASGEEGAPIHEEFAARYGMNLFIPRLYDHGRYARNTFKDLSPQDLVDSALEALEIAKMMGEQVIIMSCSTGSTLSIALAAQKDPAIHSLIMYSPNIDLYDPNTDLLLYPWGRQIANQVIGGEFVEISYPPLAQKYWNTVYHIDGIFALQSLIEQTMNKENFDKIEVPVYLGCYYKDEAHQDQVVSVPAMKDFINEISTPADQKEYEEFPKAGRHVIASYVMSEDYKTVAEETYLFAEEVLALKAL